MYTACETPDLAHMWVVYPGRHSDTVTERMSMLPSSQIDTLI